MTSKHPEQIKTAYETGLTKVFLPEFDAMMETGQNHPHHCYSVGEHTIMALKMAAQDKVVRLTMLLHDIAKPQCKTTDEKGIDHFYGHPDKSCEMAFEILRRLKFDNDTTKRVCALVRIHDQMPKLEAKYVRKALHKNGIEQYPALFAVKHADIMAQSEFKRDEKFADLKQYELLYEGILKEKDCLSIKDLAVTGSDLIALGMQPGKAIGEILNRLLELVLEHPEWNTKEKLLEQVHNL